MPHFTTAIPTRLPFLCEPQMLLPPRSAGIRPINTMTNRSWMSHWSMCICSRTKAGQFNAGDRYVIESVKSICDHSAALCKRRQRGGRRRGAMSSNACLAHVPPHNTSMPSGNDSHEGEVRRELASLRKWRFQCEHSCNCRDYFWLASVRWAITSVTTVCSPHWLSRMRGVRIWFHIRDEMSSCSRSERIQP